METTTLPRKNPTEWLSLGKFFEYEKHQVFYIKEGKGSNLVLLHGFPTCSWDYSLIFASLVRYYQVSAIDLLGFGYSSKPAKFAYSIHKQADLLESFLEKQAFKRVRFVLHDYSVSIGQEILARYAERGKDSPYQIDGMVFLNGGLLPDFHRQTQTQKILQTPILGSLLSKFYEEKHFAKSFSKIFGPNTKPDPKEIANFWKLILYPGNSRISAKLLHYIKDRQDNKNRWSKALAETNVPLLFLFGLEDPVSGKHMFDALKVIPFANSKLIGLDGIGHYPQWEAPETVYNAIREFFPTN